MIQIITDSTADLTHEIAQKRNICVVPLYVHIDDREFRDGVELSTARLFELVEKTGSLPKTSASSVADFIAAFGQADESFYVGISTQLSATVANAATAAQSFAGKARVIDSLNLSTGIGLLALRAADLRDRGCSAQEIEQSVRASIPKVHTSFVVETMEYLYKGGRCTAVQAFMGSLLKIRPVIEVKADGVMGVKDKLRGSRAGVMRAMLDDFEAHLPELDRTRIFVTHCGCPEDADYLAREIKTLAPEAEVLITEAGAVISSHCGPGTIGILFLSR